LYESANVWAVISGSKVIQAGLGIVVSASEHIWIVYIAYPVRLAKNIIRVLLNSLAIILSSAVLG